MSDPDLLGAQRTIDRFEREGGPISLAYFAALPVALTPELLHLIRVNFFHHLLFTVESQLLLSPLCVELGDGLYEIPPKVRELLLQKLFETQPDTRLRQMATLLWEYSSSGAWASSEQLARAQQLTALNLLTPDKAQAWLDDAKDGQHGALAETSTREWFVAMSAEIQWQSNVATTVAVAQQKPVVLDVAASNALTDFINAHFNLEELKALAFILGIDYDSLSGMSRITKAHDFVRYMMRNGRLEQLLAELRHERPGPYAERFGDDQLSIAGSQRLTDAERRQLIHLLAHAKDFRKTSTRRDWLVRAGLSNLEGIGLGGSPETAATRLVNNLEAADVTSERPRFQALGALVDYALRSNHPKGKDARFLAGLLVKYRLTTDENYLDKLVSSYGLDSSVVEEQTKEQVRDLQLIFISYAMDDAEFAQRLAKDLRHLGYRIWIAPDSITPGENWVSAIYRGLAECGVYLLVLSPAAARSEWVKVETEAAISQAQAGKIRFIPALLNLGDFPRAWQSYQYAHFNRDYRLGLDELRKALPPLEQTNLLSQDEFMVIANILAQYDLFLKPASRRDCLVVSGLSEIAKQVDLSGSSLPAAIRVLERLNSYGRMPEGDWALSRLLIFVMGDEKLPLDHKAIIYGIMGRYELDEAAGNSDRVAQLTARAKNYFDYAYYDEALTNLNKALRLEPYSLEALELRARVYSALHNFSAALDDLDLVIHLEPARAGASASRGQVYQALGRYDAALADLRRATYLDPKRAEPMVSRGQVYQAQGRYAEALADYAEAIRLDPTLAQAFYSRGRLHADLSHEDEALADYSEAIRLNPAYAQALYNRGLLHDKHGRNDAALADFDRAIELDPRFAWAIANRGKTYRLLRRYDAALADFDRAIELDPKFTWAIANRGKTYRLLRRYDAALADFDRAIELDPKFTWAIENRGETYQLMGRYDAALADFDRAIELDPHYARAIASRGKTNQLMERYDEALADFHRAIELDPANAQLFARRGEIFQEMARYEEALADFSRALTLAPTDVRTLINRANTNRSIDNYQVALYDYHRALSIDQDNVDAISNLGRLLVAMNNLTEAQQYFERALAICERDLGPDHPDTARSLTNLGTLLCVQGELARAQPYYERALAIRERALGPEHPATAQSLNNLGLLLQDLGDLAAARPYLERALAILQRVLGPDHPDTKASLNNLNGLLSAGRGEGQNRPDVHDTT